jgi:hypothetical protein
MIETELRELADTSAPPPIDTVYRRGAVLRRRRQRATRAGTAAAVVAVVAGLAATGLVVRDDRAADVEVAAPSGAPLMSSFPDTEHDCGGFAEARPPDDADGLRLLPAWLPAGEEVEAAWARAELLTRETCPRVSTALTAADATTGAVTRAVRVDGPSPEPFARYEGPLFEPIAVRGTNAEVVSFPGLGDLHQIRWTEPAGGSWLVESRGLAVDELRRVVEELTLAPATGTATAGWLPADLEVAHRRSGPPADLPDEQRWWHATIDDGATLSLGVTENVTGDGALAHLGAGVSVVEVRGHPAIAHTNGCTGDDCTTFLGWQESARVEVDLSGSLPLDTLVRIAESLEPVAADDPRIG